MMKPIQRFPQFILLLQVRLVSHTHGLSVLLVLKSTCSSILKYYKYLDISRRGRLFLSDPHHINSHSDVESLSCSSWTHIRQNCLLRFWFIRFFCWCTFHRLTSIIFSVGHAKKHTGGSCRPSSTSDGSHWTGNACRKIKWEEKRGRSALWDQTHS